MYFVIWTAGACNGSNFDVALRKNMIPKHSFRTNSSKESIKDPFRITILFMIVSLIDKSAVLFPPRSYPLLKAGSSR